MKFSIVIPNYNSEKWIIRLLDSIKAQTYKDYELIIVDDISQDNSFEILTNYLYDKELQGKYKLFKNDIKRFNGGTRNEGVKHAVGDYILFADCDDYFYRTDALDTISQIIDREHSDLIRLPYHYLVAKGEGNVSLAEPTLEKLTKSVFVAPWTKCIKRELFVPFPENTLIEDVSQHIAQMDKIETMSHCPIPIMVWNCRNEKSISNPNQEKKSTKRQNSYLRILPDLLDLEVTKPYCIEHKNWRIRNYIEVAEQKLKEIKNDYMQ